MATYIQVQYSEKFNIDELGDLLRDLTDKEYRKWYYDEITFSDVGNNKGIITLTYKDYTDSVEPDPALILSEFDIINYKHIESIIKVSNNNS